MALSNLALAYPESTSKWRVEIRRRLYDHLGWTVAELMALQRDTSQALDWVEEVHDSRHVEESIANKKGLLLVTPHYGNWELLGAWYAQYFRKKGLRNFYVISQNVRDKDINRLIVRYRRNSGVELLSKKTSTLEIVRLLKAGAHVGILPDISWAGGLVLPFMGHPCTNTIGPAVLGTLASVSIVPVTIYRKAPFRHEAIFLPPLQNPEETDRRVKIEILTREINSALEKIIEPRPEQWFWLHNRWKK
jgi:KDO2-lipid IV(A) lauroyltransferase